MNLSNEIKQDNFTISGELRNYKDLVEKMEK